MNCPNCNETLVMTDRQGVEIDYCPKCRGVWLDKGELDKLIERTSSFQGPQENTGMPLGYADDDDYKRKQYPGGYRKRRKGFLGDLFDFD